MVALFEQRNSKRTDVRWPVSLWNPMATRFYNGKSINVSGDGALVALSMQAPIAQGQEVEINFPRTEPLARSKGRFARIKTARVVRIDRSEALDSAIIKVGLEFQNPDHIYTEPLLEPV